MPVLSETDPEIRDSPIYWFVVLTEAKERGDFARAAEAQKELDRLGIRISYRATKSATEQPGVPT